MSLLIDILSYAKVEMEGLTGRITFDRGRRMDFALDILQLQSNGLKRVSIGHVFVL